MNFNQINETYLNNILELYENKFMKKKADIDFLKMISRCIKKIPEHCSSEHELKFILSLKAELDTAIKASGKNLVNSGLTYEFLGKFLGITKQAVFKRFSEK